MRISTEQLQPHLQRGLRPLYAVFGDETLLALEAADRIRARASAEGYTERQVLTVDGAFRWSELAFAASSRSLFATRKLLELRVPTGKPGADGSEALQAFCEAPPQDTITLVSLPGLDWRAQKAGWFEALDRAGVLVEARPVSRRALPEWLAGRLKAQKQEADGATLDFIAERVEGNLLAAHQEVQKLALLLPPGRITLEQAREAVLDVARYNVFGLGEALLEGDVLHLVRTLDGLRAEGVAPPLVLWAVAEECRAIARVLDGLEAGKSPPGLWRDARIRGNSHQQLMDRNVKRFTRAHLEAALAHAARLDRMVKGLTRGDVWDELLQLCLRFVAGAPSGKPSRRGGISARGDRTADQQPALF